MISTSNERRKKDEARALKVRRTYKCSVCGKAVEYDGPWPEVYPFCSVRCRRVDLGRWFRDQYVIEREMTEEELADAGGAPPPEV